MSPYPADPVDATGPMRLVVTALPEGPEAERIARAAVRRRLAACAQIVAAVSVYRWKGRIERGTERVLWFKTSPKRVGALFRFLAEAHPYEVPEILEVDVARVHGPYLSYLADVLDVESPAPGAGAEPPEVTRRRGARRARGARRPARTRARRRRR